MKYKIIFFDFLGVFIQPRSAAMLFRNSMLDGFILEMKSCIEAIGGAYTLCIISSSSVSDISKVLDAHDITSSFSDIICSTHKGTDISLLLKEFGLSASEALFVTDTCGDLRSVRQVEGLNTAAVCWGIGREDDLSICEPTFLIKKVSELQSLLS
ncbi:MAG: HAD hydrolase-like protein [Candidatus Magasanikbacteria bacterium]|uniref:HAD family hydrolase n=1 Tax=Candidatus Magasanikbacteria bacterium CG10_big_fil_rev_8_21_14_0_10_38_6 TaxID=1974647 RepID=A0A2M6NZR8_9BACT|nr:HAD hydrolase-like protein [Candidatus Magasanikbacteria bacterium]NCS72183.1 HAD hydrolase-like protein [Candidatus Magasanikbacteria bacterium]PIR76954.1 MAG: hypothetical protein COU30_05085 [Candidatus Magasanikbacteria bacterium CG10_big_fil_rev_8_21_14_0_10_38_6]